MKPRRVEFFLSAGLTRAAPTVGSEGRPGREGGDLGVGKLQVWSLTHLARKSNLAHCR